MESPLIAVDLTRVQTNIVNFKLAPQIKAADFVEKAKEKVENQSQNIKILISMKNYNLNTLRCN